MLNETPRVTVYISTCNRLEKLKRALHSVLNQSYPNIEIIVCDDASSDGTRGYVESLIKVNENIRYLRNDINAGACATRNLAIFKASGLYITGLDDDDEFTPDRINRFVDAWNDKYSFLCCNFIESFNNGIHKTYYKSSDTAITFSYKDLLFENVASNQIFTLTERLQQIGGFDPRAKRLQDWDTWLRLSYNFGNFKRFPFATYIMYHDHSSNEQRVSKSYSFADALSDLKFRNNTFYNGQESDFMSYVISLANKNSNIKDTFKWAIKNKAPGYFLKYFSQRLGK